jgi:hypothetical protein
MLGTFFVFRNIRCRIHKKNFVNKKGATDRAELGMRMATGGKGKGVKGLTERVFGRGEKG